MAKPSKRKSLSRTYILRPCGRSWLTFWRHQFGGADQENEQLVLGPGSLGRALRFIAASGHEEGTVDVHWDRESDLHVVVTAARFTHTRTAIELCEE